MSVTRIRIVTNPDGSLSLHARPGKDREGLSPDEQALSERFDRLADVYRSGLLSTEEIGEALHAVQAELDRRQP